MIDTEFYESIEKEKSIQVRYRDNEYGALYQLNAPYQFTYHVCSGVDSKDYLNCFTFSPLAMHYCQESFNRHNSRFNEVRPHYHDYYEFMVVLEGSVIQKIEDNKYLYNAGTCCLINRSLRHYENYEQDARLIFVGLSVDYINKLFTGIENSYYKQELDFKNSPLYKFIISDLQKPGERSYLDFIPVHDDKSCLEYLDELAHSVINSILYPHFGIGAKIDSIICDFLERLGNQNHYNCSRIDLSLSNDFLIFSRISHLLENSDGRLTRNDLEKELNYSGDYLNRIVNKYTGMCLYDYGMTYCFKKAAHLLRNTDESISAITDMLGFSNRTHFNNLFKKEFHQTPKEFRIMNRSK